MVSQPDVTTLSQPQRTEASTEEALVLTIASHPELERIGAVAILELPENELSRAVPDFCPVGETWGGEALDDAYISRKPVRLVRTSGGLRIDKNGVNKEVIVDGEQLRDSVHLCTKDLRRGVVLELSDRVTLVLRLGPRPQPVTSDDFGILGFSGEIAEVREEIAKLANLEPTVLIRGRTGTGKELVARALHKVSRRGERPMLAVNIASVPPTIAASELFGCVKGAFTGASYRAGYFRKSHQGTLFLDEVGDSGADVQTALLRVLEAGEVVPVGDAQVFKVDVRVIAATDANLDERIAAGTFSEPLRYRLEAYNIWMPTLVERPEDIGRLFLHFAKQELEAIDDMAPLTMASPERPAWIPAWLMARLIRFSWPGNVRQLRNFVSQLVIKNCGQPQLRLPRGLQTLLDEADQEPGEDESASLTTTQDPSPVTERRPSDISIEEALSALSNAGWQPTEAARALGIKRPALYAKVSGHPDFRLAKDLSEEDIMNEKTGGVGIVELADRLKVAVRPLKTRMKKLGMSIPD